jgi:hypothetical protein
MDFDWEPIPTFPLEEDHNSIPTTAIRSRGPFEEDDNIGHSKGDPILDISTTRGFPAIHI